MAASCISMYAYTPTNHPQITRGMRPGGCKATGLTVACNGHVLPLKCKDRMLCMHAWVWSAIVATHKSYPIVRLTLLPASGEVQRTSVNNNPHAAPGDPAFLRSYGIYSPSLHCVHCHITLARLS
jgi:hypothetical protein